MPLFPSSASLFAGVNISTASILDALPGNYLLLLPNAPIYTIAEVNVHYSHALQRSREELKGKPVFDAFPQLDNLPKNFPRQALEESLSHVINLGSTHEMA